jgi:DUF4097 and DUF4098 domain-containing protein YvlB
LERRILDEEILRLPAKYRMPFVLCYLEGLTNEEAARRLECPKGTLQSRLSWARKRLRSRLLRRGVAPFATLSAAGFLHDQATAAVPAKLLHGTVLAARAFGGWTSSEGVLPARAAILAKGVLHAMFLTKVKITAVVLLAGLLPATGASLWMRQAPAAAALPAEQPTATPPQTLVAKANDQQSPRTPADKKRHDDGGRVTVREVVKKSFRTGAAPGLNVETFNGSIQVTAGTGTTITVEVTKQAHGKTEDEAQAELKNLDVTMTQDGDAVRVNAKRRERHPDASSGASAKIQVPPGAVLELKTYNGGVTVSGGGGAVNIGTSNGAIGVRDHTGKLNLRTSNGAIDIRAEKAAVTAKTSNGAVTFAGSLAAGDQTFHTSNGSITVSLPKGASFRIDADTSHGRVSSTFSVHGEQERKKNQLHGNVGDNPKFSLKLHTSNGSIHVREADASSVAR